MKGVELYAQVRYAVQIKGLSRREAARQFGIDPRRVAKMLAFSVPPGYRRSRPPARPKLDPFTGMIDAIMILGSSVPGGPAGPGGPCAPPVPCRLAALLFLTGYAISQSRAIEQKARRTTLADQRPFWQNAVAGARGYGARDRQCHNNRIHHPIPPAELPPFPQAPHLPVIVKSPPLRRVVAIKILAGTIKRWSASYRIFAGFRAGET